MRFGNGLPQLLSAKTRSLIALAQLAVYSFQECSVERRHVDTKLVLNLLDLLIAFSIRRPKLVYYKQLGKVKI